MVVDYTFADQLAAKQEVYVTRLTIGILIFAIHFADYLTGPDEDWKLSGDMSRTLKALPVLFVSLPYISSRERSSGRFCQLIGAQPQIALNLGTGAWPISSISDLSQEAGCTRLQRRNAPEIRLASRRSSSTNP